MSDREQLIRQIADASCDPRKERLHEAHESYARIVLSALDRLGFAVVPVAVPAEAPRIAGDELEGSEATTGAERAVLDAAAEWAEATVYAGTPAALKLMQAVAAAGLLNGDTP